MACDWEKTGKSPMRCIGLFLPKREEGLGNGVSGTAVAPPLPSVKKSLGRGPGEDL